MFPEGMDMNALLAQAQQMQAQLQKTQQELAETTFKGTAGGRLVEASVLGTGELIGLKIDPDAVDLDDLESLSDLIIAAVRDASGKAAAKMNESMPDLGGIGL